MAQSDNLAVHATLLRDNSKGKVTVMLGVWMILELGAILKSIKYLLIPLCTTKLLVTLFTQGTGTWEQGLASQATEGLKSSDGWTNEFYIRERSAWLGLCTLSKSTCIGRRVVGWFKRSGLSKTCCLIMWRAEDLLGFPAKPGRIWENDVCQGICIRIILVTVVTVKPDTKSKCNIFPFAGRTDVIFWVGNECWNGGNWKYLQDYVKPIFLFLMMCFLFLCSLTSVV